MGDMPVIPVFSSKGSAPTSRGLNPPVSAGHFARGSVLRDGWGSMVKMGTAEGPNVGRQFALWRKGVNGFGERTGVRMTALSMSGVPGDMVLPRTEGRYAGEMLMDAAAGARRARGRAR